MNPVTSTLPAMSVVLASPDNYATIETTLSYLRVQTVRETLEIILVAPTAEDFGYDVSQKTEFFDVRLVESGPFRTLPELRALGVRQSSAPIVVITEDHSYPTPTWAEALIAAHEQPWAAVGPVMANANPASATSWAQLYMTYGQWVAPLPGGIVEDLPGHNSSYKRALLLEYGSNLETMLEMETLMHQDMRAKGHQLFLDPAAVTHHINITLPASLVKDHLGLHRMVTAEKAKGLPAGQRLFGSLKSLAMIPLHVWRAIRFTRRTLVQHRPIPAMLPHFFFTSVLRGAGDALGYLFGSGNSQELHWELEFHRERHIAPSDRLTTASYPGHAAETAAARAEDAIAV